MRNYWTYSIGLVVVWAVILGIAWSTRAAHAEQLLWVFGGFVISWVSGTIARYVYPPPRRWTDPHPQ